MRAGEDLDQRRFPGAVVADKGDNLAAANVQVDVCQSGNGAEILRDASKAQHRRGVRRRYRSRFGHGVRG